MNQIQINQNENQLITISNNELQNININQNDNQLITISNNELQNIDINQNDNQLIYISNEGSAFGITNVLVNGVSVVSGNIAYVIVPTKTSDLTNDSGYITRESDPTVPAYIKAITLSDINKWNNKQDLLVSGTNIKTINNNSLLGSGNIDIEGSTYTAGTGIEITNSNVINNLITSYNDLSNLPTIPTKTSDLINDNNYVESSNLSAVAFSGSYLDLIDDPVIPQNTSDLYNDSGFITNTVNDLTNYTTTTNLNTLLNDKQDTLVSGTNIKTINGNSLLGSGDITIGGGGGTATDVQINGTSITSNNVADIITEGVYNSTTNKIATISDLPTATSDLTNDSNFISYDSNGNVNIPVSTNTLQSNGNTYLRYNTANSVVLSSNSSELYLRPNGTSNSNGQAMLSTNGNLKIVGDFEANAITKAHYIELGGASLPTPYIDFHFNDSSSDYTSRIIETSSGNLEMQNNLRVNGNITKNGNPIYGETVLFTGDSNNNITLNDSAANYTYLEIWFRPNDSTNWQGYEKVYSPNGKTFNLNYTVLFSGIQVYIKNSAFSINGTSITQSYGMEYYFSNNSTVSFSQTSNIYITRVVGLK